MSLREDAKMAEINRLVAALNEGEDYWRLEIPVIREDSLMMYWPAVVKNGGHPFNVRWDVELRIWKVEEDSATRMEITTLLGGTAALETTMAALMQYAKQTYSDKSAQVYELVEHLNQIDETDLTQQEKDLMRDIWAAER